MTLKTSDFYFGALLSRLIQTGFAPAIFESGEKRRIYSLFNNFGDYKIYSKYASKPNSERGKTKRWDFTFTADEVNEIKSYENQDSAKFLFGFVCGIDSLRNSEILLLTYEDVRKCFGIDYKSPERRVSVVVESGSWNFIVYGTGLDRKESSFKITRNIDKRLEELGFESGEKVSG